MEIVGDTISNGSAAAAEDPSVPPKSTLNIVKQRFKKDEQILYIFESYQLKGPEYVTRLLVLVSSESGGTYAIVAFSCQRTPISSVNELVISKVFAIDDQFKFRQDDKSSIAAQQFDLFSGEEGPIKYYYYPSETANFEEFYAKVVNCQALMTANHLDTVLNFRWLNDYRQIGEVKQELKKRESEYMIYQDTRIYCATWNVNNKQCLNGSDSLRSWLSRSEQPPDIYAIGIQELYVPAKNMLSSTEAAADAQWIQTMINSMYPGVEYSILKSYRMMAVFLIVIVREPLKQQILNVRCHHVTRGIFNALGNKGGVGISLQLNEGNICFINSHLAAHSGQKAVRNQDYQGIVAGMNFEYGRTINDHDHIFWLGDLNYRLKEREPQPGPLTDPQLLLIDDELREEMSNNQCFVGYSEGDINFQPTYKFEPNTDNYDMKRLPSYCDRILWKGTRIDLLEYNSIMEIRQSDHKPVYGVFHVKIKTRDQAKYKRVQEEVLKAVDKRENDNQPQIEVDKTIIDFGRVRFNEPCTSYFNVYNTCPLQVDYSFKEKDMDSICEPYLQIEPREGSLLIDSARSIWLNMHVDVRSISSLLRKIRTNDNFDILILHVKNGRDIFITVTGDYQPSCFGLSMETMCRTDRALSDYSQSQIKELMNNNSPHYRVTMPREFFLLIDYLYKQGAQQQGAFPPYESRNQLKPDFNAVRDWLDTWSQDPFPGSVETAAQALLLLLDLPDQALLEPFVENLLSSVSKQDAMNYIDLLSPPNRNVFMHLCMFLRVGIESGYYDMHQVAATFGRILLRSIECAALPNYHSKCCEFMKMFIESDEEMVGNGNDSGAGSGTRSTGLQA
ncbi:hypothetical protein KR026_009108 [Drosophila bipectinata]|nr:hypothetical protein KR026_009108 [Drosophila bipectinata]